jgi:hypothetical protein
VGRRVPFLLASSLAEWVALLELQMVHLIAGMTVMVILTESDAKHDQSVVK